jgi:hypothetical protein
MPSRWGGLEASRAGGAGEEAVCCEAACDREEGRCFALGEASVAADFSPAGGGLCRATLIRSIGQALSRVRRRGCLSVGALADCLQTVA